MSKTKSKQMIGKDVENSLQYNFQEKRITLQCFQLGTAPMCNMTMRIGFVFNLI